MQDNICRFVPASKVYDIINIINFVFEGNFTNDKQPMRLATYRLYFVLEGKGTLRILNKTEALTKGDLLFLRPDITFSIDHNHSLKYLYISFIGGKANYIIDKLKLNKPYCIIDDYLELEPLWTSSLSVPDSLTEIHYESVLLLTFSAIGQRCVIEEKCTDKVSAVIEIKKHIDDRISDCELTLESIGRALNYHPKYVSALFKKEIGIGISKYITTLRIQHACSLMAEGFTSIKDIAGMCGYKDAIYFSKIFKERMGISPKKYIDEHKSKRDKAFHDM